MIMEINGGIHTIEGDVEHLDAHGGVYYVKGKVGTLIQHGGILYDQRPANRVEIRESEMSKETERYYQGKINDLKVKLKRRVDEVLELRKQLDGKENNKEPADCILIDKIHRLERELEKEKAARQQEVDELNERIDVAMEINAKLRRRQYNSINNNSEVSKQIAENHIDILATLLSLFPYTPTGDLMLEFGLPREKIRYVASILGQVKSKEARKEAVEYLRKQGIELVERRGGDQSKLKKKKTKNK